MKNATNIFVFQKQKPLEEGIFLTSWIRYNILKNYEILKFFKDFFTKIFLRYSKIQNMNYCIVRWPFTNSINHKISGDFTPKTANNRANYHLHMFTRAHLS